MYFSSLFLCWAAKAALKYFHDIDSLKAEQKLFGLFEHRLLSDKTGLLFGFPDLFPVPVSRWKSPKREDIARCAALEIVADSEESGPNIVVESDAHEVGKLYPKRVYIFSHPEYDTDTLGIEYRRDSAANPAHPKPRALFPERRSLASRADLWRRTATSTPTGSKRFTTRRLTTSTTSKGGSVKPFSRLGAQRAG